MKSGDPSHVHKLCNLSQLCVFLILAGKLLLVIVSFMRIRNSREIRKKLAWYKSQTSGRFNSSRMSLRSQERLLVIHGWFSYNRSIQSLSIGGQNSCHR
jgi:hypothetical protein